MNQSSYSIPVKFRKMENLHIVFWLFKDLSWCMIWKPLGIIMIVPTITIAIIIAFNTKAIMSELCHNLAVVSWIAANSYWMISEFFDFDKHIFYGDFTYKHLATIPFAFGILILAYYYAWWKPRNKNLVETM